MYTFLHPVGSKMYLTAGAAFFYNRQPEKRGEARRLYTDRAALAAKESPGSVDSFESPCLTVRRKAICPAHLPEQLVPCPPVD